MCGLTSQLMKTQLIRDTHAAMASNKSKLLVLFIVEEIPVQGALQLLVRMKRWLKREEQSQRQDFAFYAVCNGSLGQCTKTHSSVEHVA